MSLEVHLDTETTDATYATAEEYCADYYDLRVDEVEEAVVADYVEDLRSGSSADASSSLVSIDALCSPNATSATAARTPETLTATFSIRFVAYASSLFSREGDATLYTVQQNLEVYFQDKVDSGSWDSDRLAHTTDSRWTGSSRRRLEDSTAAQDYISPQSVVGVETVVVETLNPTGAPSSWLFPGALSTSAQRQESARA